MKYLLLALVYLCSLNANAGYSKPQLLALSFSSRNYNLPLDSYCYLGTPTVIGGKTFLNCQRDELHELMMWDEDNQFRILQSSRDFFSVPQSFNDTITWYEYDQESVIKVFQWKGDELIVTAVTEHARSVTYLGDKWIYHAREGLSIHRNEEIQTAQIDNIAYVFSPSTSASGDYAVKVRRDSLDNSSPDEIWSYKNDNWVKVFSDKDGDPNSKWLYFSNAIAVGDGKVFVIARDEKGEALIEISDKGQREIVRQGKDVASFESFNIAYNNGSVVFRAVDFLKRKAVYVVNKNGLQRVLTQGDTVLAPNGIVGVVDYPNSNSVIYNNPGIGGNGEVIIQATLLDFDDRKTLLGIGVISIKQEEF